MPNHRNPQVSRSFRKSFNFLCIARAGRMTVTQCVIQQRALLTRDEILTRIERMKTKTH